MMKNSIKWVKRIETALICALMLFIYSNECRSEVEFQNITGSDLEMGIGARAVGMSGAFVAVADDASAAFWNPSGLTQIPDNELFLSVDLPREFNSASLIYRPGFKALKGYEFTMGLALVKRLRFNGDSGSGTWEGRPSHLLDGEYIFGTYSGMEKKDIKMLFLRGGVEKEITPWLEGRMGIVFPVIARTSTLGNIRDDMPSPKIGGSVGLGFKYRPFVVDLGIYGDPAKSYMEQKAVISSVVSITLEY